MDTFLNLPEEKRQAILDAAMTVFAKMGYRKASVSDIAAAAGISKAAVFHYFGSKKALYLYLIQVGRSLVLAEFSSNLDYSSTDFFDRVLDSARIKVAFMHTHPPVLAFLGNAYYETDAEVANGLHDLFAQSGAVHHQIALEGTDLAKFKDDVDPQLVLNILVRFAEGYASPGAHNTEVDFDALMREFEASLDLMKRHFYKEEYL